MRDRMAQIEAIVHEALSVSGPQRQHIINRACGEDQLLRREVTSLLALEPQAADFLAQPVIRREQIGSSRNNGDSDLDRTVGAYRLVERIGSGGMGNVYRAVRDGGGFDQTVAIKLIRNTWLFEDSSGSFSGDSTGGAQGSGSRSASAVGDDIVQRFRIERQILANLDHPNIARLIDGGSTDDGRPYIVMEQVRGERIDRYCDAHRLTVRQRLELFRIVCDAVQYAHRNLVVHRDLKPSNVLVADDATGVPIVKLLDFGIAKVLRDDRAAEGVEAAEQTQAGGHRLTPSYASPEQVRAESVTTASDVYSLGVMLYELLCGRKPYDFGTGGAADMERAICQTPPTGLWAAATGASGESHRPPIEPTELEADPNDLKAICEARSTDAAQLRKELGGDIEKIVMHALRKEPERRYATVEAFSEDIRRCLAGLPVAAQGDAWSYRTRKFVARHRAAVVIASVVMVTLVAATLISSVAMVNARRAQERAEASQRSASAVASYLKDMLTSIDPAVAQARDAGLVRDMLDQTSARLAEQRDQNLAPREAAELHQAVAVAYHSIGEYQKALNHLARAIDLRSKLEGETLELASAWHEHSRALFELSRRSEAEQSIVNALMIRAKMLDPAHPEVAMSLAMQGNIVTSNGEYERGEPLLRTSVDLLRAAVLADPQDDTELHLARALTWLGDLLNDRRRPAEAEPLLLEARAVLIDVHGEQHPTIAGVEQALAWCCRRIGGPERVQQAVAHHERALEINRAFFDPNHPTMGYSLNGYASALEDAGRLEDATAAYLEAERIIQATIGEATVEFGTVCNNLGNLYRKLKRFDEAAPLLVRSAEVYALTRAGGANDMWVSFPLLNLARAHLDAGDPAAALPAAEEALRIRLLHLPGEDELVDQARIIRAEGLISRGVEAFPEAERDLRASHERMLARYGEGHPGTELARTALVRLYEAWDRPEAAARLSSSNQPSLAPGQ